MPLGAIAIHVAVHLNPLPPTSQHALVQGHGAITRGERRRMITVWKYNLRGVDIPENVTASDKT